MNEDLRNFVVAADNTSVPKDHITVYFIGGGFIKILDENGVLKNPLLIKNRVYNLPPIGESIVLPINYAKDLADRLRVWSEKTNGFIDGITDNPQVASAVKQAFFTNRETMDYTDLTRVVQLSAVQQIDTKDLEAELERRRKKEGQQNRKAARKGAEIPESKEGE